MEDPKAHVALLIDFDGLARAGVTTPAAELATALRRYAGGVGRLALARGYADWSLRAEDARAIDAVQVAPVLCPVGPAGEDRGHVRLVVDALEALYAGGEPDAYVVATADTRLLPLIRALRGDGCDLLVIHPSAIPCDEMTAEADVTATIEDVLGGAVGPASTPRVPEEEEEEEDESPAPPPPVPPRSAYGAPRGFEGGRGPGRGFGPGGPPDVRGGRPDRGGYGERQDRPSFGDRGDRPERGGFGDRPQRPGFGERAPRTGPVPPRAGSGSDFRGTTGPGSSTSSTSSSTGSRSSGCATSSTRSSGPATAGWTTRASSATSSTAPWTRASSRCSRSATSTTAVTP